MKINKKIIFINTIIPLFFLGCSSTVKKPEPEFLPKIEINKLTSDEKLKIIKTQNKNVNLNIYKVFKKENPKPLNSFNGVKLEENKGLGIIFKEISILDKDKKIDKKLLNLDYPLFSTIKGDFYKFSELMYEINNNPSIPFKMEYVKKEIKKERKILSMDGKINTETKIISSYYQYELTKKDNFLIGTINTKKQLIDYIKQGKQLSKYQVILSPRNILEVFLQYNEKLNKNNRYSFNDFIYTNMQYYYPNIDFNQIKVDITNNRIKNIKELLNYVKLNPKR